MSVFKKLLGRKDEDGGTPEFKAFFKAAWRGCAFRPKRSRAYGDSASRGVGHFCAADCA
jgi:hypothetical protein